VVVSPRNTGRIATEGNEAKFVKVSITGQKSSDRPTGVEERRIVRSDEHSRELFDGKTLEDGDLIRCIGLVVRDVLDAYADMEFWKRYIGGSCPERE
jgi:hypothetical protein